MSGQNLPFYASGAVIKGFGRGSKDLGCPTANLPDNVVDSLPNNFPTGVYFGFGQVANGMVHKMVMSVGWNPFYHNQKKSMEVHLIHKFQQDFYGEILKIVILGYLRTEKNFSSVEELIKAIDDDIQTAKIKLDQSDFVVFQSDKYFLDQ